MQDVSIFDIMKCARTSCPQFVYFDLGVDVVGDHGLALCSLRFGSTKVFLMHRSMTYQQMCIII